ncbi:MAG: hypothetical protein JO253_04745 [Alphaproteobacteria bacterium]|nr:hypothetical protein [Alphaproteobacteria bacterium]
MGNLKAQGFRLLANKERNAVQWVHPAQASLPQYQGFTDCTDMDDEQFGDFICNKV